MRKISIASRYLLISGALSVGLAPMAVSAQNTLSPIQATAVPITSPSGPAPVLATPPIPKPAEPVTPLIIELPAETVIAMTAASEVNSKKLKLGDRVELVTTADVVLNSKVIIPSGTKGYAIVQEAVGGRAFGRGGQMMMKFENLLLANGTMIALKGVHTENGARTDANTGGNLAATGAALGGGFGAIGVLAGLFGRAAISGKSALLKPGKKLTAVTALALRVAPDGMLTSVVVTDSAKGQATTAPAAISLPSTGASDVKPK